MIVSLNPHIQPQLLRHFGVVAYTLRELTPASSQPVKSEIFYLSREQLDLVFRFHQIALAEMITHANEIELVGGPLSAANRSIRIAIQHPANAGARRQIWQQLRGFIRALKK